INGYISDLAPSKEFLAEFKEREEKLDDHDAAFEAIHYEKKFDLGIEGLARLSEIAEESRHHTVYLVCHCAIGQYCHREILMILAEDLFGAKIAKLSHSYETFRARLHEFRR
ncbi:MAG TPA: DUF488 family protein, partial [Bdellovibrionales bacterium]|nr:DUF488 family protein [Bdellovibrionales bacterium]